jgi:hypothetical protein
MKRILLAALVVVLLVPLAGAKGIKNGNFTDWGTPPTGYTSDIPDWTVDTGGNTFTNQTGIFFVFDGVSQLGPGAMALAATSTVSGANTTTLKSSTFTVDTGDYAHRVEFKYVYFTGETAEGAAAGRTDPATVSLVDANDPTNVLTSYSIDATDEDLVKSDVNAGPLSTSLLPPGESYRQSDGDWTWVRIDTSAWVGQDLQIWFSIEDSIDGARNSGFLVDEVKAIPEPGTLVLFGLGLVGCGYAVRRRTKNKKS